MVRRRSWVQTPEGALSLQCGIHREALVWENENVKTCSRCGQSRPQEEFPWRYQAKGERGSICRECMRTYNRAHYERNKAAYVSRAAVRDMQMKRIVREAKAKPCADCGVEYPYYVMDLDHLGDKEFSLSSPRARAGSVERLKTEIAKCDVVCANCHRARTHNRAAGSGSATGRPKACVTGFDS